MLQRTNVPFDIGQDNLPTKEAMYVNVRDRAKGHLRQNLVGISNWIRAIYLDTGDSGTFLLSDVEPYMQDTVKSNVRTNVANK